MSDLLLVVTGPSLFNIPPEIERAHCSLSPRPGDAGVVKPRPFIVIFQFPRQREHFKMSQATQTGLPWLQDECTPRHQGRSG